MSAPLYSHSQIKTLVTGIDHSEGICVGLNGDFFLGSEAGQVYKVSSSGQLEVIGQSPSGGILLGLTFRKNGNLIICDAAGKCVWDFNPITSEWKNICDEVNGEVLHTPNWGCYLDDGSYIFSDSGGWKKAEGKLIRILPNGESKLWSTQAPNFPNGIALTEDGSGLLVLESTPGRLLHFDINADGSAGIKRVLVEFDAVPDGVTVTRSGELIISCYRPDVIYYWSQSDGLRVLVEDVEGTYVAAPTNTVLVGPNLSTLVWPNFGRWNIAQLETRFEGVPLKSF
jgi:gluconolactonase